MEFTGPSITAGRSAAVGHRWNQASRFRLFWSFSAEDNLGIGAHLEDEDIMAKTSRAISLQEVIAHPEAAKKVARRPGDAQYFAERFDPFHEPYIADLYPFFAEVRPATPVFYSPDLDYWVVTRYHDIEQIFHVSWTALAPGRVGHVSAPGSRSPTTKHASCGSGAC